MNNNIKFTNILDVKLKRVASPEQIESANS
jgi:hypothetical protein